MHNGEGKQPGHFFTQVLTKQYIAQGFKLVKAAQLAAVALAAVLAWGFAAALGQGVAPLSKVSACILVGERRDDSIRHVAFTVCDCGHHDGATSGLLQILEIFSTKASKRLDAAHIVLYRQQSVCSTDGHLSRGATAGD